MESGGIGSLAINFVLNKAHPRVTMRRTFQRGRRYRKKKADSEKGDWEGLSNRQGAGYQETVKENVLFEKYYQVRPPLAWPHPLSLAGQTSISPFQTSGLWRLTPTM